MRDISIKAKTIGTNVVGSSVAIEQISGGALDSAAVERLLSSLMAHSRSLSRSNCATASVDIRKLTDCMERLAESLRSEEKEDKKKARIEGALKEVSGLLGGTTELLRSLFQLAGLFGVED